ncbi:acyl-CoA N-acyltransferase [Hypoxylon trugodes]|uniref:acyl-CoA N-acyltransferase n=1 Tax=Hypoxylon trugodes TaxID=326681 RepID=UPI00219B71EE|nr:acyl-CoA N-acyltransferase [Hypoxylon trugodes]KAI1390261.1 acyl-CoA N-acyltransferase [Hypoxylon trugodes]
MPLELQPATEADARRSAQIEHEAYAPNPNNKILFPGPFPPNILDLRAGQLAAELKQDPTTRWLKIIDTDLPADGEQMVAFAKWHVYDDVKPHWKPRTFGAGCNGEACELLFGGVQTQRERILAGRNCVYLSLLHTDPKHQKRGAGELLVKWGIEEAKKLGLIAYLDSSPAGHSLYRKCGFRDVECLTTDLSTWGGITEYTWSMIYDPAENAI